MRKLLLFILLAAFSFGYGQNLNLSQLMSLRNMSLDKAESFLTGRGWNYAESENSDGENMGFSKFVYGDNGDFNYAQSFLWKLFSQSSPQRIIIQIHNQSKYLEYLNAVKSYNPELVYTGIEDGDLVKMYEGATTTFIFKTSKGNTQEGKDKTFWLLTIRGNDDF